MPIDEAEAAAKHQERKAAFLVRRAIQKVRVATPETYDTLHSELIDMMQEQVAELGTLYDTVVEETEKGLAIGKERVDKLLARRQKIEEEAAKPRALMKELYDVVEAFEGKIKALKTAAHVDNGEALSSDDVPQVEKLIEELTAEVQNFVKTGTEFIKTNQLLIAKKEYPHEVRQEWAKLSQSVEAKRKEAEAAKIAATQSIKKSMAKANEELLDKAKAEVKEKMQEIPEALKAADTAVTIVEEQVAPLARPKTSASIDELISVADDLDGPVTTAEESIEEVEKTMRPADLSLSDDAKKGLEAWIKAEMRLPRVKLGQVQRRLGRVVQIVKNLRAGVQKARNAELLEELKPRVLENVKAEGAIAAMEAAVAAASIALDEAESQVQPLNRSHKMEYSEAEATLAGASTATDAASDAVAAARQAIRPFDDSLDEDLKKQLRKVILAETRKVEIRYGQIENRLRRCKNWVSRYSKELDSKSGEKKKKLRDLALKVLRNHQQANKLTVEAFFSHVDHDSSGSVDVSKFTAIFAAAERKTPSGESVDLPADIATEFFKGLSPDGKAIGKEAFVKFVRHKVKVVKATPLTKELELDKIASVRSLKAGEVLEVLEGPVKAKAGVMRVRVKSMSAKVNAEGWATMAGNAGTPLLTDA